MTPPPPINRTHGWNYPNYSSIMIINEEEQAIGPVQSNQSDRRGVRQHRRAIFVVVATIPCLIAFIAIRHHLPDTSPSHLLGPLLEPYLDGDGSRNRRKAVKALEELKDELEGSVIFADNDHFCDAIEVWKQGLQPPLAVIEAASEADVQLAVPVLAEIYMKRGIPFRIRSGGHSYGGFSTVESGIVLSLSGLNNLAFDESTGVATIGPAVKTQDMLDKILVPVGYGGVIGDCPGVAEGGFILGK